MRLYGQWLSWLWVSLALVWPQTPALARVVMDTTDQWEISRVDSLPLLCDVQQPDLKKLEALLGEEPNDFTASLHGTPVHDTAPISFVSETLEVSSERPVFAITPGLPLSRGPPAQV
jgi:hypothetical protein